MSQTRKHIVVNNNKEELHNIFSIILCKQISLSLTNFRETKSTHLIETVNSSIWCPICRKNFKKPTYLASHKLQMHSTGRKYECPICDKSFIRKYNMEKHIGCHLEDHVCTLCCSSFISTSCLQRHQLHKHTEFEKKTVVQCKICNLDFQSKLTLYRHKQLHHRLGFDTVECYVCQRHFKNVSILDTHMKRHRLDGEAAFKCATCGKYFSMARALKDHQHLHSADRPYKCKTCNASFRYQSNLHQHSLAHKNERRFKCVHCSVSFLRAHTLKEHLRTHSNIKPYKCEYCAKTFVQSSVRQKHVRSMHRRCEKCGALVGKKSALLVHMWNNCQVAETEQSDHEVKL